MYWLYPLWIGINKEINKLVSAPERCETFLWGFWLEMRVYQYFQVKLCMNLFPQFDRICDTVVKIAVKMLSSCIYEISFMKFLFNLYHSKVLNSLVGGRIVYCIKKYWMLYSVMMTNEVADWHISLEKTDPGLKWPKPKK